jgi:hypothetical protein
MLLSHAYAFINRRPTVAVRLRVTGIVENPPVYLRSHKKVR